MQQNRLGCFTGTGIITVFVTALVIVGVGFARGGALFSPGELNAQPGSPLGGVHSHAELGGNCDACHTAPWDSAAMADRCTSCHGDVAVQMRQVASLHGQLVGEGSAVLACYDCHPEHRGANASLVDMNGQQFPHEGLGFSLERHRRNSNGAPFNCQDCHTSDIKTFDQVTCQDCHLRSDAGLMQPHGTAYGSNCLGCHDGVDRFSEGLNHSRFLFRLDGKHAGVSCDQCHAGARQPADFASTPQDCFSCHKQKDPHAGKFGQDCLACHSTTGWTPAKFDHDLSAFKLTGAHANVPCAQCHVNNVFQGTPAICGACHAKDDAHNGQFGTDCSACHSTAAWKPSTFDHQKSNFPLTGAHATVTCQQCHTAGQFQGLSTACASCHQDPTWHAGVFGTDCASCHTTRGWSPALFNRSHPTFGDEGGVDHGGATCQTCHLATVFQYTCLACHKSNNPGDGGGGD